MLRFAFSLIIQPFDRNILSSSGGCVSTYNKQCYQMVWRRCCIELWNDERKSRAKHEPECQLSVYKEEWNRSWIVMLLSFRRLPNVKRIHLLWMNITLLNISTIIYVGILSLSHLFLVSYMYTHLYVLLSVVWLLYKYVCVHVCSLKLLWDGITNYMYIQCRIYFRTYLMMSLMQGRNDRRKYSLEIFVFILTLNFQLLWEGLESKSGSW